MQNNELYHIGMPRRSGRYPWGSGARPFQSGGGSISKLKSKKAEKEKLSEEQRAAKRTAEKEKTLKSGTATEILKFKGELTNREMQEAVTRLNLETQLINISIREIESGMQKIDRVMKGVKTGTEWVKIGTDTYNTFAGIYNATAEGQKNPMTLIGKGDKKKKGSD